MAEWHYVAGGEAVGAVTAEEIESKFRERVINRDTLIWTEGMPEWRPMHEIETFNGVTRKSSPPPLPGTRPAVPVMEHVALSVPDDHEMPAAENEQIRLSNLRMSEPPIPWTRYFARMFDISVLGTLLLTIAFFGSSYVSPKLFLAIYTADPRVLLFLALPVVLVLNGIIITLFGNSPGKKLFGIHVINVQTDQPFSLYENIARELRVWIRGLAIGIPLVNLFTMIPAFRLVNEGKPTSYDDGIASVRPYSDSSARRATGMVLTLLIFAGILTLNAIDKQHLERVSRPYSWTNPVTNMQTTIPGGWENETVPGPSGTLYAFTNLETGVVAFLAVETSGDHTLVSYADALEASLSPTMTFDDWARYVLPDVWKRTALMKEGNHPAALLLRKVDSSFWRVVYVDQVGTDGNRDVENPELTRALFMSVGVK